ncbi:hypothetical protein SAMN05421820_103746 [Pedobacter steynii]|uniref:Uncharacterized protein n=1 Tax=Pedobacter steynii TaxID=430522 RepID=A0A1G9SYY8_9SPHI|nr:hypothetical protein [Pedobacter steynii]NQX37284.1 hypothetical protein [Pedobacter steynii]SDM40606.1 hypothetical protein SAMN05421820_103746 [Pedobacter steynii]
MGLFDFFKKKDRNTVAQSLDPTDLNEIKSFALQAVNLAIPEIEESSSFLPFGGALTNEGTLHMIVYHAPDQTTIDHRAHATIIQDLVRKAYKDKKNVLCFMAWDGIAHLPTGDKECITVKVDDKATNIHKMFIYPYTKTNGKVKLLDKENPMIR